MTREVIYERNVTGSYMKVPMTTEGKLDEKILLKKNLQGLLPMEKIYVNQGAWYWYNISGKQSLDHCCRVRCLESGLFERIVISICKEIEEMKQNYLSPNCLVLDSEYIFISNQTQEIVFMAYPGESQPIEKALQMLVEYLLTKIDHKDVEAVRKAYEIYEKTLDEAYTLEEIRDSLIQEKKEEYYETNEKFDSRSDESEPEVLQQQVVRQKGLWKESKQQEVWTESDSAVRDRGDNREDWRKEEDRIRKEKRREGEEQGKIVEKNPNVAGVISQAQCKFEELISKFRDWKEKLCDYKERLLNREEKLKSREQKNQDRSEKRTRNIVVMPEDLSEEDEELIQETVHPTICLSDYREHPRGLLLYEGTEDFSNILLNGRNQQIGKSKEVTVYINKDTISGLHAGIWFEEQEYYLEDYNSTNGTFVNNEPLAYKERRKLQCNDIVRFADVKYRFV